MKLFFGGSWEPRVEEILGLVQEEGEAEASGSEPRSHRRSPIPLPLAPPLERGARAMTWEAWNLTRRPPQPVIAYR